MKKAGIADAAKENEAKQKALEVETEQRQKLIDIEKEAKGSENMQEDFAKLGEQIAKEIELETKAKEDKKALRRQAIEERLGEMDEEFELSQSKLMEQFFTGQLTEEELREQGYQSEKAFLENRLNEMALLGVTEVAQYQDIYTQLAALHYDHETDKTKLEEAEKEKRSAILQAGFGYAKSIFAGAAELLASDVKNRKKNLNAIKAMQTAEVLVNTITEVSGIFKGYSALGPFGQIAAIVQAAVAVVRGKAAIKNINAVQADQSFAEGGPVFGPSHQAGGIGFGVKGSGERMEMEGNEIILTKGVYQNPYLRSLASDLNHAGGGRRFDLGGPVVRDRSFVNTSTASPSATSMNLGGVGGGAGMDTKMMEMFLAQIAEYTRVAAEKPPLVLTDVKSGLESLYDVEQDARF